MLGSQPGSPPSAATVDFYSYNQHGDVQALTGGTGATVATYGYSAYGVDDTTLDSGPDATPQPGTFPFNSFRFGSGRIDASTGNLGIGPGYDPTTGSFTGDSTVSVGNSGSQAMLAAETVGPEPSLAAGAGGGLASLLGLAGGTAGWELGAAAGAAICGPTVVADPVCAVIGGLIGGAAGGAAGQGVACGTGIGSCSASAFGGAVLNGAIWGGVSAATGGLLGAGTKALLGSDAALAGVVASPLTARAIRATTEAISNTAGYGASCLAASDCSASGFGEAAVAGALSGAAFGAGASCGGQSFTAGTQVVLAGGSTAPISALKPGDKVEATDTTTGKTQPETVSAVEVNHDTDLYDLTVKTSHGTEIIHTTATHLFWDPAKKKWVQASKLTKGEHLKTADGTIATADGGTSPKNHDGWMWDLTIPGNGDHDFYVLPSGQDGKYYLVDETGATAVLVHNCDDAQLMQMARDSAKMATKYQSKAGSAWEIENKTSSVIIAKFPTGPEDDPWSSWELKTVVSASGEGMSIGQLSMAAEQGHIPVPDNIPGLTHAEQNWLLAINKMGGLPVAGDASRSVCDTICGVLMSRTEGQVSGPVYPNESGTQVRTFYWSGSLTP